MNKDGKLFGKISIIDIGAAALVILLVFGVYIKFFGSAQTQKGFSEEKTYVCVVKVKNIRDYTVNALTKGGLVYDSTTKEYIGEIVNVSSEPGENKVSMADGTYRYVPMENRYNAYVEIEFSGKESALGYFTDTNKQLCAGSTLNMNAKFAKCEGVIERVESK